MSYVNCSDKTACNTNPLESGQNKQLADHTLRDVRVASGYCSEPFSEAKLLCMHFFGVNFFAIDTALRPSKVTLNVTYHLL